MRIIRILCAEAIILVKFDYRLFDEEEGCASTLYLEDSYASSTKAKIFDIHSHNVSSHDPSRFEESRKPRHLPRRHQPTPPARPPPSSRPGDHGSENRRRPQRRKGQTSPSQTTSNVCGYGSSPNNYIELYQTLLILYYARHGRVR